MTPITPSLWLRLREAFSTGKKFNSSHSSHKVQGGLHKAKQGGKEQQFWVGAEATTLQHKSCCGAMGSAPAPGQSCPAQP